MKTLMLFLVMVVVIAASGQVSASQGTTITVTPSGVTLLPGSTVIYNVGINTLPAGLSGYQLDFQLTNPAVGQITRVSFPSWAKLNNASSLPAGRVTISAVDLGKAIADDAAGTNLALITVEAVAAGTTNVKLQNIRIDDDHGGFINPDTATAQLVVKPGGVSGSNTVNNTSIPVVTASAGVVTRVPTRVTITPLASATEIPVVLSVTSNAPADDPSGGTPVTSTSLLAKIPRWIFYGIGLIALVTGLSLLFLALTRRI